MRGAPDVNRTRYAGHPALADATQMVGIDLQAYRPMRRWRGASRAAGAEHLGKQDRYAAMQYPHRLARARIDRRPGPQEVVAHLEKLDAEMRHRRVHVNRGQGFDRDRTLPDRGHVSIARMRIGLLISSLRFNTGDVSQTSPSVTARSSLPSFRPAAQHARGSTRD